MKTSTMNFVVPKVFVGIACFALVLARNKGPPLLKSNYDNVIEAKPGDDIRLTCPVTGASDLLIEWTKDDEQVTGSWPRFRKTGTVLRIHRALPEDSGSFICRAINGFGATEAELQLIVKDSSGAINGPNDNDIYNAEPLTFTQQTLTQPRFVQITTSSRLLIHCDVRGYPLADITWIKDGQTWTQITESSDRDTDEEARISRRPLHISNVSLSDSGTYTCLARSLKGSINISFHVEVIDLLRITETKHEVETANSTVESGKVAILWCFVRSQSGATIQWLRKVPQGNVRFARNSTFRAGDVELDHLEAKDTFLKEDGTLVSKLVIPEVQPSHSGAYVCLATTGKAMFYRTAYLSVVPYLNTKGSTGESRTVPVSVMVALPAVLVLISGAAFLCWLRIRRKRQLEANPQDQSGADESSQPIRPKTQTSFRS